MEQTVENGGAEIADGFYHYDQWMELCERNAMTYFSFTRFGFRVFASDNRQKLFSQFNNQVRPWNALQLIINDSLFTTEKQ